MRDRHVDLNDLSNYDATSVASCLVLSGIRAEAQQERHRASPRIPRRQKDCRRSTDAADGGGEEEAFAAYGEGNAWG